MGCAMTDGRTHFYGDGCEPPHDPALGCRVYWGSHGCNLVRGHEGHHRCECADDRCDCTDEGCCEECPRDERCVHNVGAFPYYGDITVFYGEDVP